VTEVRCTRSACRALLAYCIPAIHRDTREPYCYACARRINAACGEDVVELPRTEIRGDSEVEIDEPLVAHGAGPARPRRVRRGIWNKGAS
jgi:hypothetical protein